MTRLFVAALPDARVVEALRHLPNHDQPDVRTVPESNWHVTLRFIGDAVAADIVDLLENARLPAAQAVLGPSVERLGHRQIVVPVAWVDALAAEVRGATAAVGEHEHRPFRGHLTIARTKPDASSSVVGAAIDVDWAVTEIALIESELRPEGAHYTTIATFPLERPVVNPA